jgi:hypothetical protein
MGDVFQSFDLKKTLNPNIWMNADSDDFSVVKPFPDIRKHLLAVTGLFMDTIKFKNLPVEDIIFTGSLANYNWSEYSDVDLHIIINKKAIHIDPEILDDYFTVKKEAFNTKHKINIKNFDIEIYIQDVEEQTIALGMFSVLTNQWVKTPSKENVVIDKNNIRKKLEYFISEANKIDQMVSANESASEIITLINELKEKIKKYRKSGLESNGEYSDENLVFKYLRRTNYLKRLTDYKIQTMDRMLSLQEVE